MKENNHFNNLGIVLFLVVIVFFIISIIILLVFYPVGSNITVTSSLPSKSSEVITNSSEQTFITSDISTINSTTSITSSSFSSSTNSSLSTLFTTSIKIIGDDKCQSDTLNALKLLNDEAPTHYVIVTKYIRIIECVSKGSGMYAYETEPRYIVGDETRNVGTIWYASTIVHDAGHSKLYNDYKSSHPNESVPTDIWTGKNAESICIQAQLDAEIDMKGPQYQIDHIKNSLNTNYYDIPYDERWW